MVALHYCPAPVHWSRPQPRQWYQQRATGEGITSRFRFNCHSVELRFLTRLPCLSKFVGFPCCCKLQTGQGGWSWSGWWLDKSTDRLVWLGSCSISVLINMGQNPKFFPPRIDFETIPLQLDLIPTKIFLWFVDYCVQEIVFGKHQLFIPHIFSC